MTESVLDPPTAGNRPAGARRPSASALVWAVPAVISLIVALSSIGRAALWRDEMATRQFSLLPLGSLFRATSHVDRVLTPYYVFMHFWAGLGDGAVGLRLSSTIAGTITVAVTARLAQRTWGPVAGVVAGLVLAVNGVFIGANLEARPYALVGMFSAVATLLLTMTTQDRVSRRVWWFYAIAVAAATLLHVFAVLILLPHALIFWRPERRRRLLRWILAASPAVLTAGVIVLVSKSQSAQVYWSGGKPGPRDLIRLLIADTGQSLKAILLIAAIALVAAVQWRRRAVDDVWVVAVGILVLPALALLIVSQVSTPVLSPLYTFSVQIAAALLLGAAVATLSSTQAGTHHRRTGDDRTRTAAIIVVAICLITAVSAPSLRATLTSDYRADDYQTGDDYRALAVALSEVARPGDELIVRHIFAAGGFSDGVAYYLDDSPFMTSISTSLLQGEPLAYERKVVRVDPFDTTDMTGQRPSPIVWVVELTSSTPAAADPLAAQGCTVHSAADGTPARQFGDISMTEFNCP